MEDERRDAVEQRLDSLLKQHGAMLRQAISRVCPRRLGIAIEDVEQEVRVKLWKTLENATAIEHPASYIRRVAVTTTIDAIRRVTARREVSLAEDLGPMAEESDAAGAVTRDAGASPETRAALSEARETVIAAIGRLSEERRRAVGLFLQGFDPREIGGITGWSESKARSLAYRGMEELRRILRAEGIEYEAE